MSVEYSLSSSAPNTDYDHLLYPMLNVNVEILNNVPHLRLVFSNGTTYGIDVNGTGTTESLHIHYVLKHRAY